MGLRKHQHERLDPLTGVGLGVAFVAVTPIAAADPDNLSWLSYPLAALAGLALVLRRRLPRLTAVAVVSAVGAFILVNEDGGPIFLAVLVALASLGAAKPDTPGWLPVTVLSALVMTGATVLVAGASIHLVPVVLLLFAAPRIAADRSRGRALRESALEQQAARRLVEERLRIAREVHDVVGHGLATIALRAGVADHVMARDPSQAQEALRAIRSISTEALEDLGALLGVLRAGAADEQPLAPVPDLDGLPRLVQGVRDAGLGVELEVGGDDEPVSDLVGAAAYRIVQEALTNVARHGGAGARATVRLERRHRGVALEVVDDGAGPPEGMLEGGGLAGMRERASALGGSFVAGPAGGGGFRVAATLPAPR